jgi:hypothetical protein
MDGTQRRIFCTVHGSEIKEQTMPTKKTTEPVNEELEKKRHEFQEEIAHAKPLRRPSLLHKRNLLIGFSLLFVLVCILAATAVYAFWYQNPERVVTDAVVRALAAQTTTVTGTFTSGNALKVDFNGASAGAAGAKFTFATTTKYDDKTQTFGTDMILDKSGDLYMSAGGIENALGHDLVVDAANPGTYANILQQKLDGKWLRITSDQLQPYSQKIASIQSCVQTVFNKIQDNQPLLKEAADIYAKNRFIVVDKHLGSQNGSTGYGVHLNYDKLASFLTKFKETSIYTQLHDCDSATFDLNVDNFIKSLKDSSTKVSDVELWINGNHDLTEIKGHGARPGVAGDLDLKPRYNEEVKIVTPTNTVSLDALHQYMEDGTQALQLAKQNDPASKQQLSALLDKLKTTP